VPASSTVLQLLAKNAADRLGAGQSAERDVKTHAFYRRVDWDRIASRDVQPPFKPHTVCALRDRNGPEKS